MIIGAEKTRVGIEEANGCKRARTEGSTIPSDTILDIVIFDEGEDMIVIRGR